MNSFRSVLVLAGLATFLFAPSPAVAGWQRFETVDGLVDNRVFSILEDSDGVLWFGTANGVSKYDGARWRTFQDELPNRSVNTIAEDPAGDLWFGTLTGGATRYDGNTWAVFSIESGHLPGNQVADIQVDRNGELWFATTTGLARLTPESATWQTYNGPPTGAGPLIHGNATALTEDTAGNLWIGSPAGATRLDASRNVWTPFPRDPSGLAADSVLALAADSAGAVWFGTDQGAFRFWNDQWEHFDSSNSGLPEDVIITIFADESGVWFGGQFSLSHFDGETWRWWFKASDGSFLNRVASLYRDDSGNLWVGAHGTATAALYRFDLVEWATANISKFTDFITDNRGEIWFTSSTSGVRVFSKNGTLVTPAASLPALAQSVYADRDENIWIGSIDGGAVRLGADRLTTTPFPPPLVPGPKVNTFIQDRGGLIWTGTDSGAASYNGATWTSYLNGSDSHPVSEVFGILEMSSEIYWLRTSTGLYLWRPFFTEPEKMGPAQNFPSDIVHDFLGTSSGLWFATEDGLSRLGEMFFENIPSLVDSSDTTMYSLLEASDGSLWVGSLRGVSRLHMGIWEHWDRNDLATENIIALAEDDLGMIWVSGRNNGLVRYNGETWRNFKTEDGLASNLVEKTLADSRGNLWFGSSAGVTEHRPDRTAPQTIFITTPPALMGTRNATWVFGAAHGEATDLEFQVMLDGMPQSSWTSDVSWDLFGLADGTYTFEVVSRDWSRNVDPTPTRFDFEVDATPPPAVIASPVFGEILQSSRSILGTAADPRFVEYRVEARPASRDPSAPYPILIASSSVPVTGDTLATWDTESVQDGAYDLRLSVTDELTLTGISFLTVILDNEFPTADITAPKTITAAGGDVYHTDGTLHFYFPPNAFTQDVVVDLADSLVGAPSIPGATLITPEYSVDWFGGELQKTATLDMAIPDTQPAGTLAVYRWDGADWIRIGGGRTEGTISIPVTLRGVYGLFVESIPGTGTQKLANLALTPRVFSPQGRFGTTDLAISFEIGEPGQVAVRVFNRAGRLVSVVTNQSMSSGANIVRWNGKGSSGETVPDGLYIVSIEAAGERITQTLSVIR